MDQETSSDGDGGCRSRAGAPGSGILPADRRSSDRSAPTPAVVFSRTAKLPAKVTSRPWIGSGCRQPRPSNAPPK